MPMATPSGGSPKSPSPSLPPDSALPAGASSAVSPAPANLSTMSPTPRNTQPYLYQKVESPSPPPRCPSPVKTSISNGPMGPPAPRPARAPSSSSMPPPPPRQPTQDAGARKRGREGSPPLPGQGSPLPSYRRSISPPARPGQGSPHGSAMSVRRSSSPPLPGAGSPLRRPRSSSPPFENIIIIPQRQGSPVKTHQRSASPPLPGQGQGASAFKRPRSASPSDAGFWNPAMPFAGRPPMGPPSRKFDAPAGDRDAESSASQKGFSAQRSGSSSSEEDAQGRRGSAREDTDAMSGVQFLNRAQSSSSSDENLGSRSSSAEMADSSSSDRRRREEGERRASSEVSKGSSPGGRRPDAGTSRAGAMLPPPPRQPKRLSLPPLNLGDGAAAKLEASVSGESRVAHDSSDFALAAADSSSTGGASEVAQDQLSTARPSVSVHDESPVDSASARQASDASSIIGAVPTPALSDASSVGRLRAPSPGPVSSGVTAVNSRGQALAAGQSGGRAMREEGDRASTTHTALAQGFKEPGAMRKVLPGGKETGGNGRVGVDVEGEGLVESGESGARQQQESRPDIGRGALERVASNVVMVETRGAQAESGAEQRAPEGVPQVPLFARQNSSTTGGAKAGRPVLPLIALRPPDLPQGTQDFKVPQQRPPSARRAQSQAASVAGGADANAGGGTGGSAVAEGVASGTEQTAGEAGEEAVGANDGSKEGSGERVISAALPTTTVGSDQSDPASAPETAPIPPPSSDASKTLESALRALFPAAVYKEPAPPVAQKGESSRSSRKSAPGHPPYEVPAWSSVPGVPYQLEVVKEGAVLTHLDVSQKGAYMFGRSERADFPLEHATVSRYHAVLQYKEGGQAAVFDLGSTHGTFVNKKQVKPRVYVPLRVGDLLKFGQSSRLYIFQGPTELMPEEGLSRTERRQLKQLEAVQESRMAEESLVRARTNKLTEVTWGQMDDAEEEEEQEDVESITWETHSGALTSNQEKSKEKVVKRREKIANLRKEIEAIRGKEMVQGALTTGQQAQIARNESRGDELSDELENMEETLNESIRESLGAKTGRMGGSRKRGRGGSDDEDADSDDDEFYNRAGGRKKKKTVAVSSAVVASAVVETAATLLEKRDVLAGERAALEAEIQGEEARERGDKQGNGAGEEDALDAFMTHVSTQMEQDKGKQLRRQLELLDAEAARIARLLRIADPMGEAQARWTPKQGLPTGTPRRVFVEPVPEQSDASVAEEAEEVVAPKEPQLKPRSLLQTPKVALGVGPTPAAKSRVVKGPSMPPPLIEREADAERGESGVEGPEVAEADAATPRDGTTSGDAHRMASGVEAGDAGVGGGSGGGAANKDEAPAERHSHGNAPREKAGSRGRSLSGGQGSRRVGPRLGPQEARAAVVQREEEGQAEEAVWAPPSGQTGDGRTSLNDKLGY